MESRSLNCLELCNRIKISFERTKSSRSQTSSWRSRFQSKRILIMKRIKE